MYADTIVLQRYKISALSMQEGSLGPLVTHQFIIEFDMQYNETYINAEICIFVAGAIDYVPHPFQVANDCTYTFMHGHGIHKKGAHGT